MVPVEVAVRLSVVPEQIDELLPATGEAGVWLMVTAVVPLGPVHPLTVTFTEYVPASEVEIPAMVGFCDVEV